MMNEILFGVLLGVGGSSLNLYTWKLLFSGLGKRARGEAAGMEFFSALSLKSLIVLLLIACLRASGEACIISFLISFIAALLLGSVLLTDRVKAEGARESA